MNSPYKITVLALLLNGCAMLPEEGEHATLMNTPEFSETVKASTESEAIVQAWPKARWWEMFHNAELTHLIDTALHDNPSLHAATARLTQAEAKADYQAAEMLPSFMGSADIHKQRFSATDFYGPNGGKAFFGANLDLLFHYHLDLWGKDRAMLDAALGTERARASELEVVKLMLSSGISQVYLRLCSVEHARQLAEELINQHKEKLQLAQLRWQQGLASQDEVHISEQKLAATEQRKTSLDTQAQHLRHQIAALAGKGADWGQTIQISDSHFAEKFPLPDKLPIGLLARRPDVAASLWQVEAAAQLVKVAKTNFYPDIDLVGFSGLHSLNLKDLFLSHGASVAYSIGPTISLPIFEGGRLEAKLKHQYADYDFAVEIYNSTLLTAVQQVADSLATWRETVAHDATQQQALHAAKAEQHLQEQRYSAGLSTKDSVIDAKSAVLEQQLKHIELDAEHLQAAVNLIQALGGGYENSPNHLQIGQLP